MILSTIVLSCAAATAGARIIPHVPSADAKTVVFVRHAEKGEGDPRDPSLSAAGKARAEALVQAVADLRLSTIIVSDTKRARETAAPVAAVRGLTPVEVTVTKGGPAHIEGVVAAIRGAAPGAAVLVVGHSNTLAPVIAALGGPKLPVLCEAQFAPLYLVTLDGDTLALRQQTYGAADPPDAETCNP